MPYEKIGNEIITIFNKNFKNIELFFQKIINFNFNKYYSNLLMPDLVKIDRCFTDCESLDDIKNVLSKKFYLKKTIFYFYILDFKKKVLEKKSMFRDLFI